MKKNITGYIGHPLYFPIKINHFSQQPRCPFLQGDVHRQDKNHGRQHAHGGHGGAE